MRSKRPNSYVSMLLIAALTVCSFPHYVSASNQPVTLSTGFEPPDFEVNNTITSSNTIGGWTGNAATPWTVVADGTNGNAIQSDPGANSLYVANKTKSFLADSAFSGQVKDLAADGGAHPGLIRYKDSKNFYALGLSGGSLEWRGKVNNASVSMPGSVSLGGACAGGSSATYCTLNLVVSGAAMYGSAKGGPALIAKVSDDMAMSAVPYIGFVTQKGVASFDNPYATDTPLGAPGELTGTSAGTAVDLSWSEVTGADSYVIRRSTTVSGPYLYAGTSGAAAFTDIGVTNPQTYYYMVSPVSITPQGSSAEGIPAFVSVGATGLTGASGDNKIDLSWSGFASAASYTIWRSLSSDSGYTQLGTVAGGTTAYSDATAVNGTTYYYRVQAVTADTGATPSLTINNAAPLTATAGVTAPNAPTGLTAAVAGSEIALSWSPVSGAKSYSIWRSTTSGSGYVRIGTTADGSTTSYSDTGIANGTYYYVVQAVNTGGSSANSAEASATLNATPLAAPTGVTATATGDATIALSWQPVSGATGYVVLRSMRSGGGFTPIGTIEDGGANGYVDSGVENGTWYYTVQAVNPAGTGSSSAEASATLTAPDAPTGVTANADAGTQVALQWNAVSGATGYKVLRSTKNGSEYTTVGTTDSSATSFADKHIASGTTYYYVVQATNDGGSSANSQQASATPVYTISSGTIVNVSTAEQLDAALAAAQAGTTIVLADGIYTKTGPFELKGKVGTLTSPITIKAAHTGRAIISGAAYMKVSTSSAYVNVQGLRFTNTDNVSLLLDSSNSIRVTECSFEQIENPNNASANIPYMQIRGANSDYIQVDHNVFANKTQQGQGMSIDGNGSSVMSQYLTIEYNLFRNFGPRIDNGMESIRLGLSGVSMLSGYAVVQYNEFDNCDGDPESISVKTSNNTIRYNTFRNSQSQLTLRHGNGTEVYGNYFIGDGVKQGVGGIRVYGADHKIYNNYFQGLAVEGILIDNGDVDHGPAISTYKAYSGDFSKHWPVYRAQIVNNTIVNSAYGITVGHPSYSVNPKYFKEPVDTIVANNLVQNTTNEAFPETIASNTVYRDNIGFTAQPGSNPARTSAEIRNVDPQLALQADGLYRLQAGSAAIDAATHAYPYVRDDMDGQPRSAAPDIGADEYSTAAVQRQPVSYAGYPISLDAAAITLQIEAEKYSFKQGDLAAVACPACSGGCLYRRAARQGRRLRA
ncbi:Chondroitinase-B precursor [Paenibacillus konkukensis]|uniref:Chondroitinase-B n=1 Tax=Paenibacillus konkukensis TaxID=2020716 RepID=A0ABY4RQX0_9BACL|nr:chondroitinase-B domain-containing protein [Paenibacillus konkukensis]UQZ83789.1 Chondroitinase-B precursor [Paenibacillus konkukensis]